MIIFLPKTGTSDWDDEPFTRFLICFLLSLIPIFIIHGVLGMDNLWPVSIGCIVIGFVVGLIWGGVIDVKKKKRAQ